MAAASVRRLPSGPGWVFEPKFDGFRALAFCDGSGVVLQSRQQRPLTAAFPDLAAAGPDPLRGSARRRHAPAGSRREHTRFPVGDGRPDPLRWSRDRSRHLFKDRFMDKPRP
jgi:hypothetical protein